MQKGSSTRKAERRHNHLRYPKGPFWPIWNQVYRGAREPLTAWDIAQKYGSKNVCFRKAAVAILGAGGPRGKEHHQR